VSEPASAGDEEVLELGARRRRPGRRSGLGLGLELACALLLAGALAAAVVLSTGSAARRPSAVASPTHPARLTVTFDAPTPAGNGLPIKGTRCPTDAHCSVWSRLPGSALAAVRTAFPGAQVDTQITEFAYRPGRYYADLLARHIVARAGALSVVIDVRTLSDATGPITAALRVDQPGFAVSVQVGNGDQHDLKALQLARDQRLLVAQ
jgi:hypothetical protein